MKIEISCADDNPYIKELTDDLIKRSRKYKIKIKVNPDNKH